jgi:hypothetical protein
MRTPGFLVLVIGAAIIAGFNGQNFSWQEKKIEKRWGIEAAALETVPVNYVRRGERQSDAIDQRLQLATLRCSKA